MFGGKCDPGETPEQTALRELEEEASIVVKPADLHFYIKVKNDKHYQFEYLHWAAWSGDITTLKFDTTEVAEIGWFDVETVLKNLTKNVAGWYNFSKDELATIRAAASA